VLKWLLQYSFSERGRLEERRLIGETRKILLSGGPGKKQLKHVV
jgi:hypothetical protein